MKSLIYSKKIHYNSEIDSEEVIKVIHDVFLKTASIDSVQYLSSGRINKIFKIKLNNCNIKNIILREKIKNNTNQELIHTEEIIHQKLVENGIDNFAKIYYQNYKKGYCLQQYIEGRTLNYKYENMNLYKIGCLLSKIHSIKVNVNDEIVNENEKLLFVDIDGYYKRYFRCVLDDANKKFPKLIEKAKMLIEKLYVDNLYNKSDISIVHHDFHALNVLTNNENVYLIDWESARLDVSEVEFVKFKHLNVPQLEKEQIDSFFKGYQKYKILKRTSNFICHEIIWLVKMYVFETDNSIKNHVYFPSRKYYYDQIMAIYDRVFNEKEEKI